MRKRLSKKSNIVTFLKKNFPVIIALLAMFTFSILITYEEIRVPQRKISFNIDISNKINICTIEEDFEEGIDDSFFNF
jgi:hypothetical protein